MQSCKEPMVGIVLAFLGSEIAIRRLRMAGAIGQ